MKPGLPVNPMGVTLQYPTHGLAGMHVAVIKWNESRNPWAGTVIITRPCCVDTNHGSYRNVYTCTELYLNCYLTN